MLAKWKHDCLKMLCISNTMLPLLWQHLRYWWDEAIVLSTLITIVKRYLSMGMMEWHQPSSKCYTITNWFWYFDNFSIYLRECLWVRIDNCVCLIMSSILQIHFYCTHSWQENSLKLEHSRGIQALQNTRISCAASNDNRHSHYTGISSRNLLSWALWCTVRECLLSCLIIFLYSFSAYTRLIQTYLELPGKSRINIYIIRYKLTQIGVYRCCFCSDISVLTIKSFCILHCFFMTMNIFF